MKRKQAGSRKKVWLVFVLGMSSLVTLRADDFWEKKPFTQWSEKEAISLLAESPWARTQTVMGSSLIEKKSESSRAADLPRPVVGGVPSTANLPSAGVNFSDRDSIPLYFRWYSSRKIRQALGRLAQIQGQIPEAELNKFIQESTEEYTICVIGPVMDPFNQVTLATLGDTTFLVSKKNKAKKLTLKSYTAPKDRRDGIALFSFARSVDGKPAFDLADEEVQFVTQVKKLGIKVSFKLGKMMTDGSLDL